MTFSVAQRGDLIRAVAELCEDLVGVLAEQRRALHVGRTVGHLDRIADREVLAARRVIDLDDGAGLAQRRFVRDLLHRENRSARDVVLVEDVHRLELGLGLRPFLDLVEDFRQMRQPRLRRRVPRIGQPFLAADHLADGFPDRRLGDEVDVGVGIGFPALALENPSRLPAAGGVARARDGIAERAVGILRVLLHDVRPREPLLIAQLHAAEIEHAVLHRGEHALTAARRVALVQGGDDAQRQMQSGSAVADLRAGDQRRAVVEAGRRRRAAGTLRDVLVDLAVFVRPGAEALDRRDDHARVELVDALPGEAHAVERARSEVLHEHIALLDQRFEDRLAFRILGVDRDRALVRVEHREVQAVHARNVAQLAARDVPLAGAFDLDDVGSQPREQLRARRTRLNVREVENANAV